MLGAIFWVTFVLSLIACIVFLIVSYAVGKKFYPLMYILAIFAYINFIAFTIDAFELNKNWVILLLAVSSVLFILLGVFFSRIRSE